MVSVRDFNSLNLRETDTYYLIGKALKSEFGLSTNTLFFEVPVGGSRADIIYIQTPAPWEQQFNAGVHLFEVKTARDSSRKRLKKQVSDYMRVVDYVWLVGVNKVIKPPFEGLGQAVFSTCGCSFDVLEYPKKQTAHLDLSLRQNLLSELANNLKRKASLIEHMAWVNPPGESRVLVQRTLD